MSRGLGRIQKRCLDALANRDPAVNKGLAGVGVFETIMIALAVFDEDAVTAAQYASVRRALGTLARKGLVKNLGRHFHNNRGRWALPDAAKAYLEKTERDLRTMSGRPPRPSPRAGEKSDPAKR